MKNAEKNKENTYSVMISLKNQKDMWNICWKSKVIKIISAIKFESV